MKKEVNSFVKLVVAMLQGDDAEVTAIKIQRKAKVELKSQIAVKEAHTLTLEENVEEAEEALQKARLANGEIINSGEIYIIDLLQAKKDLENSKEILKVHKETVKFLKEELALVSK